MRKYLNNPWIVTALAVAAIAFVWFSLAPTAATPSADALAALPAPAEVDAQPTAEPSTTDSPPRQTALEALKLLVQPKITQDPFASRATNEPAKTLEKTADPDLLDTVRLSALWTQNGTTLVLLNERICNVGDAIGRLTIESATPQGVWLSHYKGRSFLALGKSFTLRTPVNQPAPISNK